jgi:hypothetical protein
LHRIFWYSFSHTELFPERRFSTQTLLHTKPLHTDSFTHRLFTPGRFSCRHFYTHTLLHTDAFIQTQKLAITEAFTDRSFHTQRLFTHRYFYTQTHKPFLADALLRAVKDVLADLEMNVIELFAPNKI